MARKSVELPPGVVTGKVLNASGTLRTKVAKSACHMRRLLRGSRLGRITYSAARGMIDAKHRSLRPFDQHDRLIWARKDGEPSDALGLFRRNRRQYD
jgi:hypothetical protein